MMLENLEKHLVYIPDLLGGLLVSTTRLANTIRVGLLLLALQFFEVSLDGGRVTRQNITNILLPSMTQFEGFYSRIPSSVFF